MDEQQEILNVVRKYQRQLNKFYWGAREQSDKPFSQIEQEMLRSFGEAYIEAKAAQKSSEPPPVSTEYDQPEAYKQILKISKQVERVAEDLNISINTSPIVASLSSGSVNACAISPRDKSGYAVLLDIAMLLFLHLTGKILAFIFSLKLSTVNGVQKGEIGLPDPKEFAEKLRANQFAHEKFSKLVYAYVYKGNPSFAPRWTIPNMFAAALGMAFCEQAELFIMGHEYGHIIEGHLSKGKRLALFMMEDEAEERIPESWKQELEADLIGARFAYAAGKFNNIGKYLSCCGPEVFFGCQSIVNKAVSLSLTGQEDQFPCLTHPPVEDRRNYILNRASDLYQDINIEDYRRVCELMDITFSTLWDSIKQDFYDSFKNRVRVSPVWYYTFQRAAKYK